MKPLLLAATVTALLTTQGWAADPKTWIDAKRMVAFGTLAVVTTSCRTPLTPQQDAQIKTGLQLASATQQVLTQREFTEAMKAVGAEVGENKDEICAGLTPESVAVSLKDAIAGI